MACSDKRYFFLQQTLGKSCVIWATNFSQTAVSQNQVFRIFFEIHPVDLAGGAKKKYSKSMHICQCTRHVHENYVWLPISRTKFRPCHPKSRGRWKSLEWWNIRRIVFVNEAFVTWAWSCASVMHSTWLVQTSNTYLKNTRWANRASFGLPTFHKMLYHKMKFFEDFSRSNRWI